MADNFFQTTNKVLSHLNTTERTLFDYVVKNMDEVKSMSIQKFAKTNYLSTTTIFRFTQKLGFKGYSDFQKSLIITSYDNEKSQIPNVVNRKSYSEEYLKNVMETIRVMPEKKVIMLKEYINRKPNVYIICDEDTNDIGRYCEKLFMGAGLRTFFPEVSYQLNSVYDHVTDDDLIIALSYTGNESPHIRVIENIFRKNKPFLVSITRADNNILQNMSNINFYIFADEIEINGLDLTSKVSMIMILELIIYDKMTE